MDRDRTLRALKSKHPDWGRTRLSRESGIPEASVQRWLSGNKENCEIGPLIVGGKSTLYDSSGNVKLEWVKTTANKSDIIESMKLAASAIAEGIRGTSCVRGEPTKCESDILVCYPISDVHTGLYSWADETGADFDVDICCDLIYKCMSKLVNAAPRSETCLIPNLGDFFHTDTIENKTMRSGNILDIDTRWARVFSAGVKVYRAMVDLALEKHKKVYVKSGIGNHDDHSIFCLAMLMSAYFENNKRVEIQLPINPFSYHEFGSNLIGINHGEIKPERLPLIMATDQSEAWGRTRHHCWLVGHVHHKSFYEFPGCTVESFRSPSAKDAWTHRSGYRAERDMQSIVYHKINGEVSRTRIGVDIFL